MDLKLFNKLAALATSGVLSLGLCGCSKEKAKESSSGIVITSGVITVPTTTKLTTTTALLTTTEVTTTMPVTTIVTTTEPVTEPALDPVYNEVDSVVLEEFNAVGDDIINSKDSSDFLDKGKLYFIYCVDFLFYDGEIKGVKFSDLSEMAREQLIGDIVTIDNLICSKFPNYKETISEGSSEAFDKASDIIHSGTINVKDYSREKLGDENYEKIGEYKDLFVEQTSRDWEEFKGILGSGYDKGKSKIKDWYEGFKGQ
jgi:hypothetical protein